MINDNILFETVKTRADEFHDFNVIEVAIPSIRTSVFEPASGRCHSSTNVHSANSVATSNHDGEGLYTWSIRAITVDGTKHSTTLFADSSEKLREIVKALRDDADKFLGGNA